MPPLSVNEVAITVKSIANGTWQYRNEIGTYRKHILGLPAIAKNLNEDEKNAERKKRNRFFCCHSNLDNISKVSYGDY